LPSLDDVWLTTKDDVRLHAWWFASERANLATLFLHGNAGNVTHRVEHALAILEAGSSVLILDYRGYGKSSGVPTERGLDGVADAGYEWLAGSGFPSDKMVIHGESIGTAVAAETAGRRPCAAVVLESPFTSLADMANTVVPFVGAALFRGFDTRTRMKNVRVPLLLIHGEADTIVPISQGKMVFAAANEPKTFWPVRGAGHNDLLDWAGTEYVVQLGRLYRSITGDDQTKIAHAQNALRGSREARGMYSDVISPQENLCPLDPANQIPNSSTSSPQNLSPKPPPCANASNKAGLLPDSEPRPQQAVPDSEPRVTASVCSPAQLRQSPECSAILRPANTQGKETVSFNAFRMASLDRFKIMPYESEQEYEDFLDGLPYAKRTDQYGHSPIVLPCGA